MDPRGPSRVTFFPTVHLLTGPPNLTRNGGIWKRIKSGLSAVLRPPRMMVQALHFVQYNLSQEAWDGWFPSGQTTSRLAEELDAAYGSRRDVFVDSGGFQLLHAEKIDLSKWGFRVMPSDIYRLQKTYNPQRVASLDTPIGPAVDLETARKLSRLSIHNAVWLAEHSSTVIHPPRPYLVVHGRNPTEVLWYLNDLEESLPHGWLRSKEYGLALGSQVPLAGNPDLVLSNIETALHWMRGHTREESDFHLFGVGDSIVGSTLRREYGGDRPISFDNSTYVQKAFRLRIFKHSARSYVDLDPSHLPRCKCIACRSLHRLGKDSVTTLLTNPPYSKTRINGASWSKSDILALAALHNLRWWRTRLDLPLVYRRDSAASETPRAREPNGQRYRFPLPRFEPSSPHLLLLPCTKFRPYGESRTHRRVKGFLADKHLIEGRDFDRITLSGLYGPVHWTDERLPEILSYDFPLTPAVSISHVRSLRARTAAVLNVVHRKYESMTALLRQRSYSKVFGPITESFEGRVVDDVAALPKAMR